MCGWRSKKSASYKPSRLWSFPDELDAGLKDRLCLAVDRAGQLMLAANWKPAEANDYFRGISELSWSAPPFYRFLMDLPKFFAEVEKTHQGNVVNGKVKYARNCKGLLTIMTAKQAARLDKSFRQMNPQTRSMYLSL